MGTRKDFIARAATVGALFASAPSGARGAQPSPMPSPTPKASPKASELARAFAAQMRRYDPKLTDKELEGIAQNIDELQGLGKRINPKGAFLKNGDEPIVSFEVNA